MKESGTLMQMQNKWWVDRSECPLPDKNAAEADDELSLKSLAGIFYILIAGLVLAVVIALLEFCWNSRKEAKRRQISLKEAMKVKAQMSISGMKVQEADSATQTTNGNNGQGCSQQSTLRARLPTTTRGDARHYSSSRHHHPHDPIPNL